MPSTESVQEMEIHRDRKRTAGRGGVPREGTLRPGSECKTFNQGGSTGSTNGEWGGDVGAGGSQ